ncbi:MAG TPA: hypothetical protein VK956_06435 [Verrucomicrobium sp.]|nr:hypothetical protein [Verrucomicrobium sp.]
MERTAEREQAEYASSAAAGKWKARQGQRTMTLRFLGKFSSLSPHLVVESVKAISYTQYTTPLDYE